MSRHLHIVGAGLAGLASAVFAIRDGGLRAGAITIYDAGATAGGALDAAGDAQSGYVMRGERMLSPHYVCLFNLLSGIPSFDDPAISVRDDILSFTRQNGWDSRARLLRGAGTKVDVTQLGLDRRDLAALLRLMLRREPALGRATIADVLPSHFFQTNFWLMWCTMFAFQPWHGAAEMRRYLRRFLHLFPHLASMRTVLRTRYDQHHAIVVPLLRWLEGRGVRMMLRTSVTDMTFEEEPDKTRVTALKFVDGAGKSGSTELGPDDAVIFCNGSMTAAAAIGSCKAPAIVAPAPTDESWALWQRIAAGRSDFGRPEVFCGDAGRSQWLSFTATSRSLLFARMLEALTAMPAGREGLISFADSNWLLTIKANPTPHFPHQPDGTTVWWGYGLRPSRAGNFVAKPMTACGGADILREVFGHLGFGEHLEALMASSVARPCLMPFITSQFMPRAADDRPAVMPARSRNLAFVGQFCELPDDTVFTVEYSVRSAMMAVKALLQPGLPIPPIYKGWRKPGVWLRAAREAMR